MYILGIWDGHDSGAALIRCGSALIRGNKPRLSATEADPQAKPGDPAVVVFAANEERFTRRKLEVAFPDSSIREALAFAGITPADVSVVAISTSDFSKTLTRVFPGLKERYYDIRRRKVEPSPLNRLGKTSKYVLTEIGPSAPTRWISGISVRKSLKKIGFRGYRLLWVDHHLAHAASAVCTSPDASGLVLSLDGIGDGLSGLIGTFDGGDIRILSRFKGRDSLGIFFEHVTNLLNMRELEDEGKVMALAGFGYPVPDDQNPLLELFSIDGLKIKARRHAMGLYKRLARILYRYPAEQFAYMAQRVLEVAIVKLVENACAATGRRRLAYAGGVASNIKVNMLLESHRALDGLHVFPHMGDGGLALGAALYANLTLNGAPLRGNKPRRSAAEHDPQARPGAPAAAAPSVARVRLDDLFLGPSYGGAEIERALAAYPGLKAERVPDIAGRTAGLIAEGRIVLWYQGRMEYGPRALGNRSILALPGSVGLKNKLNIYLKKRVWYQPFCPTMLADAAAEVLEDGGGAVNRFMTVGYRVKDAYADRMAAVIGADRSCRPQILTGNEGPAYGRYLDLLGKVRERTGLGVVLNTSFNKHGESIVNTPREALELLADSRFEYLVLEDLLVWKEPNI
jgi:carbamoyltransferase